MLKVLWIDYQGKHSISSCYSVFDPIPDADGFIHEKNNKKDTLALIHQFDRICPVAKNLLNLCPQMGSWHRYPSGRPGYYVQQCE